MVRAKLAVEVFFENLGRIPHPDGLVRLVQFAHDSAGLRKYRRQIAEGLVMLLESAGFLICNGLDEAKQLLEENGYTVFDPELVA